MKILRRTNKNLQPQHGFSLIEMAVVMVIISVLLGGLLVSLSQSRESAFRSDAQRDINSLVEALYGFAQATGRLPCPASATSNGLESPVGGSTAGSACDQLHGFIPSATLGLSGAVNADGLLIDPWQNPYRYSVSTAVGPGSRNAYTSPNGMAAANMGVLANANDSLQVCANVVCANPVADAIPAVVLSMGADWATFTAAAADATENTEATIAGYRVGNDDTFVSTRYSEDVFDDIVVWISPSVLFTRMIAAGQLP